MKTLAGPGVPFAIDDFGIGFSSIGYLQDMPVQIIKTDLSFSESIDRDERSCALLCSITMMGQALGLDVVVEGIERTSQLEHLRDHVHAPYAQGYLMHRPMPLDQLVAACWGRTVTLDADGPQPTRARPHQTGSRHSSVTRRPSGSARSRTPEDVDRGRPPRAGPAHHRDAPRWSTRRCEARPGRPPAVSQVGRGGLRR